MTSKLVSSLSLDISQNQEFKNDFKQLMTNQFSQEKSNLSELQIKKLLESAAILSLDKDNEKHQKLALKIAVFLFLQYRNNYELIPFVAELILGRLGDIPTISHMVNSDSFPTKDFFSYFKENDSPISIETYLKFPEIEAKKIFNRMSIAERQWNLTDFQTKVFHSLLSGTNISFSAPTSAGKSFIVHNYVSFKFLHSQKYCAVYVLPTKSLIAEVQREMNKNIREIGLDSNEAMVFTSVSDFNFEEIQDINKSVIILTQERLQQIISDKKKLWVDLLVVDEAQKVSEERRGVTIEDSIQDLMAMNPNMQKVFISPYTADPGRIKEIFDIKDPFESLLTNKTPVTQNIFHITFRDDSVTESLILKEFDEEIKLRTIPLQKKMSKTLIYPRKVWVARELLLNQGPTLVYCNGPQDCKVVAREITKNMDLQPNQSEETKEAIQFIKNNVHKDYYLVGLLQKGIGYHYGKMPHFVRYYVQNLFDEKKIDILCSTSTLLEGVNLPAKNIVIHKPKLGPRNWMNRASVRNLAGRAGRLAKDYYGNIYCVDIEEWSDGKDAFDDKLDKIESSIEKTISGNTEDLIKYLYDHKIPSKENIQSVATSLIIRQLKGSENDILDYLNRKFPDISDEQAISIKNSLIMIERQISTLYKEVILKNRSLDPRFQFELYEFLKQPNHMVLPQFPHEQDFFENLKTIFRLIAKYLLRVDVEKNRSYEYFAYVALYWIKQSPYRAILENKIRYTAQKKNKDPNNIAFINSMIDDLDDILETTLKFEYSRGMKCYCDIVKQILLETNDPRVFCVDLPDFLEAGASDPKIFHLLDVGLSRMAAIELYELLDPEVDNVKKCIAWLQKNVNLVKSILPEFMHEDLDIILKKK